MLRFRGMLVPCATGRVCCRNRGITFLANRGSEWRSPERKNRPVSLLGPGGIGYGFLPEEPELCTCGAGVDTTRGTGWFVVCVVQVEPDVVVEHVRKTDRRLTDVLKRVARVDRPRFVLIAMERVVTEVWDKPTAKLVIGLSEVRTAIEGVADIRDGR